MRKYLFLLCLIAAVSAMAGNVALVKDSSTNACAQSVNFTGTTVQRSGQAVVVDNDARLTDSRTPVAHNQAASTITSGTLDGDRLPAPSETKRGGVKPVGTPSGKYLRDDDSWAIPAGAGDVTGPATNTANYVPRWNGANSKALLDGLAVGTAANNLVQLDGSAKLPAVDGSLLTGITAGAGLADLGGGALTLGGAANNGTAATASRSDHVHAITMPTIAVANGGTGQTSYTDGQLLIGNTTGNTLAKATLTAGTGISVTNGSGTITIAATGGGGGAARWTEIAAGHYTATPASTSTLTFGTDDTATLLPGLPVKYTISSVVYYGQITACAANLLTIRGAPMGGDVSNLYYGTPEMVKVLHVAVPGAYSDATNTGLLASDCYTQTRWNEAAAYCVGFDLITQVDDSGATQPNVNVTWGGNAISTANTAAGPLVAETWGGTVVDVSTTNYAVGRQEALEVSTVKGTNGDAMDLSLDIIMVKP